MRSERAPSFSTLSWLRAAKDLVPAQGMVSGCGSAAGCYKSQERALRMQRALGSPRVGESCPEGTERGRFPSDDSPLRRRRQLSPAFGGASQGTRSADSPEAVHIVRSPRRAAKRVSAPTKLRGFPPGAVGILRRQSKAWNVARFPRVGMLLRMTDILLPKKTFRFFLTSSYCRDIILISKRRRRAR